MRSLSQHLILSFRPSSRFWNCAELRISSECDGPDVTSTSTTTTSTTSSSSTNTGATVTSSATTTVSSSTTTTGVSNVGTCKAETGACGPDQPCGDGLCCSQWGVSRSAVMTLLSNTRTYIALFCSIFSTVEPQRHIAELVVRMETAGMILRQAPLSLRARRLHLPLIIPSLLLKPAPAPHLHPPALPLHQARLFLMVNWLSIPLTDAASQSLMHVRTVSLFARPIPIAPLENSVGLPTKTTAEASPREHTPIPYSPT